MTSVIITPVYATKANNRLDLLYQTAKSVRRQTYSELVHLIVDDGSPEDVSSFVNDLNDPRARYVRREKQSGEINTASNPLNTGIGYILDKKHEIMTRKEADEMESVTFLHSDDLLTYNSIMLRMAQLGNGFIYTDKMDFSEKGKMRKLEKGAELKGHVLIPENFYYFNHHTVMWDIDFLRYLRGHVGEKYGQEGVFDPRLSLGEDRDMSISSVEAALKGNFRISYSPFVSMFYREHKKSITWEHKEEGYVESQHLINHNKHFPEVSTEKKDAGRVDRIMSDFPFSLFTLMPKSIKRPLRPTRNFVQGIQTRRKYPELNAELEDLLREGK
ncbi:MAG TPA: glycosyltransferase [Candidatus Nanoarchaeia archaeon]|nr:glycosyltransferase [Candidatus Nanoarchaeia archaeon]